MRRIAVFSILAASFGIGMQFALNQRWWGVLASVLAAALWLYPSQNKPEQMAGVSFLFLGALVLVGIFLGYSPMGALTSFVILLIAWDLDRFASILLKFLEDRNREKYYSKLVFSHIKRLGMVAGLGWCFGMIALNVRVSTSFAGALVLSLLLLISLYAVVRLSPENHGYD